MPLLLASAGCQPGGRAPSSTRATSSVSVSTSALAAAPTATFVVALSSGGTNDGFGTNVVLDGDQLLTSAYAATPPGGATQAGVVYSYRRNGNGWPRSQTDLNGGESNGRLGQRLSISGNTFVAAGLVDPATSSGNFHIYDWNGTTWSVTYNSGPYAGSFGYGLALAGDSLAVSAPYDTTAGLNTGRAYIFQRTPPALAWALVKTLPGGGGGMSNVGLRLAGTRERFLIENAIAGTGRRLAIFEQSVGVWTAAGALAGPATDTDTAGHTTAAGETVLWGAPAENSAAGALYVYQFDGSAWQQTRLVGSDTVLPDRFGTFAALSGNVLVVTAYGKGAAYIFQRTGATWQQVQKIAGADVSANGSLGISAAISGRNVAVGSATSQGSGGLYVFRLSSDGTNGSACGSDADCGSGFCAGSVCCNQRCDGGCQSCIAVEKASGDDGACGPIKQGLDPRASCADQGLATCGTTGKCDGAGKCAVYAPGLACAPSCQGSVIVQRQCSGDGACVGVSFGADCGTQACINGACAACTTTAQCTTNQYCLNGQCLTKVALGANCAAGSDCASGFCVDGLCCDGACDGSCQTCIGPLKAAGGSSGTCGLVKAGLDPRGFCPTDAPATCGRDGACDGAGACRHYGAGTTCGGQCSDGTTLAALTCTGAGTCSTAATMTSCLPQICRAGACAACAVDGDCPTDRFCSSGACVVKGVPGAACARPEECALGFCVDGVCCDSACTAACSSCRAATKTSGSDGTCGFAPSGVDPHNNCSDRGALSCGTDGTCDGLGGCRLYQPGIACGVGSCNGNLATGDACDGAGLCRSGATGVDCSPFVCRGNGCLARCTASTDCVTGKVCVAGGCVNRSGNGATCAAGGDCASGFCVEGICCDSACAGTCRSCRAANKGSGADGACGAIAGGQDPRNECTDQGAASCGTDGACDGVGACRRYSAGTSCGASVCQGATVAGQICNGAGVCGPSTTGGTRCSPFTCRNGGCVNVCTGDADCAAGFACRGGACTNLGAACQSATDCVSGFCTDGVCCDSACGGTCQSCRAADKASGADGACGPVKNGGDPASECAASDPATCGLDGQCDGAGACRRYAAGSSCGASTCAAGSVTGQVCNGSGQCVTATGGVDCTPFACRAGACVSPCAADGDCVGGAVCVNAACVLPHTLGAACGVGKECASGHCADGVCCDGACSGACETCLAAQQASSSGTNGVCGAVRAGLDPRDDCAAAAPESCGRDGTCDGARACRLYTAGSSCGATTCQGDAVSGQLCNGAGLCQASPGATCGDYRCVGSGCANPCRGGSDCVDGRVCAQGLCVAPSPAGASCSADEQCASGRCDALVCAGVAEPPADGGGADADASADGGGRDAADAAQPFDGSVGDAINGAGGGAGGSDGGIVVRDGGTKSGGSSGCHCELPRDAGGGGAPAIAVVVIAALFVGRRRRRANPAVNDDNEGGNERNQERG